MYPDDETDQPAPSAAPSYADPAMLRATLDITRRHIAALQSAPADTENAFRQQAEMQKWAGIAAAAQALLAGAGNAVSGRALTPRIAEDRRADVVAGPLHTYQAIRKQADEPVERAKIRAELLTNELTRLKSMQEAMKGQDEAEVRAKNEATTSPESISAKEREVAGRVPGADVPGLSAGARERLGGLTTRALQQRTTGPDETGVTPRERELTTSEKTAETGAQNAATARYEAQIKAAELARKGILEKIERGEGRPPHYRDPTTNLELDEEMRPVGRFKGRVAPPVPRVPGIAPKPPPPTTAPADSGIQQVAPLDDGSGEFRQYIGTGLDMPMAAALAPSSPSAPTPKKQVEGAPEKFDVSPETKAKEDKAHEMYVIKTKLDTRDQQRLSDMSIMLPLIDRGMASVFEKPEGFGFATDVADWIGGQGAGGLAGAAGVALAGAGAGARLAAAARGAASGARAGWPGAAIGAGVGLLGPGVVKTLQSGLRTPEEQGARSDVFNALFEYTHNLAGANFTGIEKSRLEQSIPAANDGPAITLMKLARLKAMALTVINETRMRNGLEPVPVPKELMDLPVEHEARLGAISSAPPEKVKTLMPEGAMESLRSAPSGPFEKLNQGIERTLPFIGELRDKAYQAAPFLRSMDEAMGMKPPPPGSEVRAGISRIRQSMMTPGEVEKVPGLAPYAQWLQKELAQGEDNFNAHVFSRAQWDLPFQKALQELNGVSK